MNREKVYLVVGTGLAVSAIVAFMHSAYTLGKCAEVKNIDKILRKHNGDCRFKYKIFGKEISFYAWDEGFVDRTAKQGKYTWEKVDFEEWKKAHTK